MITEEKNIEEAARKFFDEGNKTANEYIGFIKGAKSLEAKKYWQKGMYTRIEHLAAIDAGINEGKRILQQGIYTESEVYNIVSEAMEYGYLEGIANGNYSLKQWWEKHKK